MNIFLSSPKPEEDVYITLPHDPEFYSSGDRVRGKVLVFSRNWRQMNIEAFLICEEHAELDPSQNEHADFENRRITIAGETIDGEAKEKDGAQFGSFPFELRLIDDPHDPYLLPSYEADCENLVNAIRWFVKVQITYKGKIRVLYHDLTVIPSQPVPVSDQQVLVKDEAFVKAYCSRNWMTIGSPNRNSVIAHDALLGPHYVNQDDNTKQYSRLTGKATDVKISGALQLPAYPLHQYPSMIPMKLVLFMSSPQLLAITNIDVMFVAKTYARIHGQVSEFTSVETLARPLQKEIRPLNKLLDLTRYVSSISVDNTCPGFTGKWLTVKHEMRVVVSVEALHRRENKRQLVLSSEIDLLPPVNSNAEIDAPPRYTPPTNSSFTSVDDPHLMMDENHRNQANVAGLSIPG